MNKRSKPLFFLVLLLSLSLALTMLTGCYTGRIASQKFIEYEERQVETITNAKEATKLMLQEWPFRSGVLHGAMQSRLDEIPAQTVDAFAELNMLAEKYATQGLDDYELGRALGLRMQMFSGVIKEIIREYAPSVFKYLTI